MIIWNLIGSGSKTWATGQLGDYNNLVISILSQLEAKENQAYWDTDGLPTIGIGFNLHSSNFTVRDQILDQMDLTFNGANYRQQIIDKINSLASSTPYVTHPFESLDTIMAIAAANGAANRPSFRLEDSEIPSILAEIILSRGFEAVIDSAGSIPLSHERAALISLVYGNDNLMGPSLRNAIGNGDRAEAWFEIRYRSNADVINAKRRYIESQIFSLFDNDDDTPSSVQEALLAFRMLTKHEKRIANYEIAYSISSTGANGDLNVIDSGHIEYGQVRELRSVLYNSASSAADLLVSNFADMNVVAPGLRASLQQSAYSGSLLNPNITDIWVASHTQGQQDSMPVSEVAAHTVDRSQASSAISDFLFDNPDAGVTTSASNGQLHGADTQAWSPVVRCPAQSAYTSSVAQI